MKRFQTIFFSKEFSAQNPQSDSLRVRMNWGLPLRGYKDLTDRRTEQNMITEKFVVKYLDVLGKTKTPGNMRLYYGGKNFPRIFQFHKIFLEISSSTKFLQTFSKENQNFSIEIF
jgi:hypothetical protein